MNMTTTDLEVISISKDGLRLSVKADGTYAVLTRTTRIAGAFMGVVAGKRVSVPVSAAKSVKGG
jgi:phage tail sheath gpL-like